MLPLHSPLAVTGLLALLAATPVFSLDSWHTVPGSDSPVGSGSDKIRGVNLGGWFVLENWMQPSLFNPENTPGLPDKANPISVADEWTFTSILGREAALQALETHWDTWITEDDFKRMADYGLNTVRLPLPHWTFNLSESTEPYVGAGAQIPYMERALNWSSMYGLDVIVDLHTLPGSQSGQDNSGRLGDVQFFYNQSNVDRGVDALGKMVAWATQDKFNGVVKAFELVNEPYIEAHKAGTIPWEFYVDFLVDAYAAVRANELVPSGGNVSMVVIHDCFRPLGDWEYFFQTTGSNWTNYALDTHVYQAFGDSMTDEEHIQSVCAQESNIAASQSRLPTFVGEFSLGVNTFCVAYKDCFGLTMDDAIKNITSSNEDVDTFLRGFWEAQIGAYEKGGAGWIFWNWKTELAPTWSYEQGVAQRWIPVDLDDKLYTYNSTQPYCLSNEDYSNVPDFPSSAISIESGTHSPVGPPVKTSASASTTEPVSGAVRLGQNQKSVGLTLAMITLVIVASLV